VNRRPFPALLGALASLFLLVGACAARPPVNVILDDRDPSAGYRRGAPIGHDFGDVFFVLALSGGGTRAASLAYGVLKELRDTPIGDGSRSLLDEVDTITAVSGGSIVAAYYGLHRERIFEDFEDRFLRRNVQREMFRDLVRPLGILRLLFTNYDRSDISASFYDRRLYQGASYADLERRSAPLIQISATDVSTGAPFTFVQEHFDPICSDLSQLPVSRAVAASTAVPGLFTPIVLTNHAGTCDYEPPEWVEAALADRRVASRTLQYASDVSSYLDPEARPYVHLVDGGSADNLGLRAPLAGVIGEGGIGSQIERRQLVVPPRMLIVVVNAMIEPERKMDRRRSPPNAYSTINTLMGNATNRYTLETMALVEEQAKGWARDLPAHPDGRPADVRIVDVSFERVSDPATRLRLNNIPTTFVLDDESVDDLIDAARDLLRADPDYAALVDSLR
jgi:NTE family protein